LIKEEKVKPVVGIIMGSDSDLAVMSETARMLEKFSIPFEIEVTSAHRSPARTHEYASTAIERGLKVVIVAAGGAAHRRGGRVDDPSRRSRAHGDYGSIGH
jgi:5-(carboxyamino)imidazole ribonucleotide mutase